MMATGVLSSVSHAQVQVGGEDFESYTAGPWDATNAPAANPAAGGGTADIVASGTSTGNELVFDANMSNRWESGIAFNMDLSGNISKDIADYSLEVYVRFDPATVDNLTNTAFELQILNTNDISQGSWYVFQNIDAEGMEAAKTNGYTFVIPMDAGQPHFTKDRHIDVSASSWRMYFLFGNQLAPVDKPLGVTIDTISVKYTEPPFINLTGSPEGFIWTNSPSISGTVIDGTSEVDSMTLYLDGALVASNNTYAGGSTTSIISFAATDLEGGTHTGMVTAVDATLSNSVSRTWTFIVPNNAPAPVSSALALYSINFEGSSNGSGGGLYPVANGSSAAAPPLGSNNWLNVDYGNPWYFGWQSKTVSEASGETNFPAIGYELLESSPAIGLYIPWTWGSGQGGFSPAATNTIWATAVGGANADLDFELRGLIANVSYDLYLYFTCPVTTAPVTTTYSITTGSAPYPEAILTSTQDPLWSGFSFTNNFAINTNYVVITDISPVGGKIGFNALGDSVGGGLSALQLVARQPVASVVPNIWFFEKSEGMASLTWDSEPFISYNVWSRPNLQFGSWNEVTNGVLSAGDSTSASVPSGADVQFYSITGE